MNESKRIYPYKKNVYDLVQRDQLSWFYHQFIRALCEKFPNMQIIGETATTNKNYESTDKLLTIGYYVTVGMLTSSISIIDARTCLEEDWPLKKLLQYMEHPDRCIQSVEATYGEVLRSAASGGEVKEV